MTRKTTPLPRCAPLVSTIVGVAALSMASACAHTHPQPPQPPQPPQDYRDPIPPQPPQPPPPQVAPQIDMEPPPQAYVEQPPQIDTEQPPQAYVEPPPQPQAQGDTSATLLIEGTQKALIRSPDGTLHAPGLLAQGRYELVLRWPSGGEHIETIELGPAARVTVQVEERARRCTVRDA